MLYCDVIYRRIYSSDRTEFDLSNEACEDPSSEKVVRLLIPDEGRVLFYRVCSKSILEYYLYVQTFYRVLKGNCYREVRTKKVLKWLKEGRLSGHFGGEGR